MNKTTKKLWVTVLESLDEIAQGEPVLNYKPIQRQLVDARERLMEEFGNLLVEAEFRPWEQDGA